MNDKEQQEFTDRATAHLIHYQDLRFAAMSRTRLPTIIADALFTTFWQMME